MKSNSRSLKPLGFERCSEVCRQAGELAAKGSDAFRPHGVTLGPLLMISPDAHTQSLNNRSPCRPWQSFPGSVVSRKT